jgi:hypothetical protein
VEKEFFEVVKKNELSINSFFFFYRNSERKAAFCYHQKKNQFARTFARGRKKIMHTSDGSNLKLDFFEIRKGVSQKNNS